MNDLFELHQGTLPLFTVNNKYVIIRELMIL